MTDMREQILARIERHHADGRDEIPISWLIGHIADEEGMIALRRLRQDGWIEQSSPGYWKRPGAHAQRSEPL